MKKIHYKLSFDKEFDNIQDALAYRNEKRSKGLRGLRVTYFMPQPIIPTWVVKILKFFNLYK